MPMKLEEMVRLWEARNALRRKINRLVQRLIEVRDELQKLAEGFGGDLATKLKEFAERADRSKM